MDQHGTDTAAGATFRGAFRKKLVDLFLNDYSVRRDRGELLYKGKWITPEEKYDFMEMMKKEHKHLLHDSILLLLLGFVGALVLVLLVKIILFPS